MTVLCHSSAVGHWRCYRKCTKFYLNHRAKLNKVSTPTSREPDQKQSNSC